MFRALTYILQQIWHHVITHGDFRKRRRVDHRALEVLEREQGQRLVPDCEVMAGNPHVLPVERKLMLFRRTISNMLMVQGK